MRGRGEELTPSSQQKNIFILNTMSGSEERGEVDLGSDRAYIIYEGLSFRLMNQRRRKSECVQTADRFPGREQVEGVRERWWCQRGCSDDFFF